MSTPNKRKFLGAQGQTWQVQSALTQINHIDKIPHVPVSSGYPFNLANNGIYALANARCQTA